MLLLNHLQGYNQVIDDNLDVAGKLRWNIGAYFNKEGYTPYGYWGRGDKRFSSGASKTNLGYTRGRVRSSVRF